MLVGLSNLEETALAMRVTELFSFRQGVSITVRPVGYQGKEGTWVVALIFRIAGGAMEPLEGAAYINPRQTNDLYLLHNLAKQESFVLLFVSPRVKVMIGQKVPWSVQQRQEVRLLLAQISHWQQEQLPAGSADVDFVRARQEFERLYSINNLLTTHTLGGIRVSSSFRGVVLE
jgi:hypothetical protein